MKKDEKENKSGCVDPAEGPIAENATQETVAEKPQKPAVHMARVGGKAPDFQANAFHEGTFKKIKLSDFLGKWVVLCFYPGDFTFV